MTATSLTLNDRLMTRLEESVDRVYQPEDIKRYLSFARLFKPKLTEQATEFLVEQYRHLRQRDVGSGVKNSWRITVRQLESMIRLSEAMARMSCCEQVLPKHVKEAYRLLNKSIIRVDQPEVALEDDDDVPIENDEDETMEQEEQVEADQAPQKKQMKLTVEEYRAMANVMVHYLRRKEAEAEEENQQERGQVKKSELVAWYLEEVVGDDVESQEELAERKQVAEKVVDRLAFRDNVLIPLSRTGLARKGADVSGDGGMGEDPVLVVHPNYVADE